MNKLLLILICSLFFISCKEKEEVFGENIRGNDTTEIAKPVNKKQVKIEDTFPFSEADKIEVISYPVRYNWDTLSIDGGVRVLAVVKDKKLQVNAAGIKERVILNDKLKKRLFDFLFNEDCGDGGSMAGCFDPRHSVLFYNKNNEIIAYFEVCLDCATSQSSEGFEYNHVCYERIDGLAAIFKEAGIKYFEENE